ncbi:Glycosyl hydrolases family 16 [Epilithonimonas bovis DSM 19482]|uniref:Glycosyl hydrolases family 16 n=1 Tax=Epilithonimonas bovis DSM 19482 TaxID=1121284 RepID=A0A1U7PQY4_9FLAO|nr:glycoside hydrolase family 16 protein [Epilithonimonas bovis]SIT95996.1 Glycosyl hydrolases family 16 [Epilithonimonas bovis DSM 19482]
MSIRTTLQLIAALAMLSCKTYHNGKKLVWHDEFNQPGLPDPAKWTCEVGGNGFGNNELQFYTNNRTDNARVEDGHLIIEARKEKWENRDYTSAKLVTKNTFPFQYGSIEVRAKLPKGKGTWPAIWMLSQNLKKWPDDGEIDIMEHVGYHEGFIHGSVHTKKYNHIIGTQKTDTIIVKDATKKFHIYRADWSPDKIEMYVDNHHYFTYVNTEKTYESWPFDQPFYLIINQAVGGNWCGKEGVDSGIYPQKFLIDYVRIYKLIK